MLPWRLFATEDEYLFWLLFSFLVCFQLLETEKNGSRSAIVYL